MIHEFHIIRQAGYEDADVAIARLAVEAVPDVERDGILPAFRRALSKWAAETPEGGKQFRYAGEGFNVGDLTGCFEDGSLRPYLDAEGLGKIELSVLYAGDADPYWEYDTPLMTEVAEDADDGE